MAQAGASARHGTRMPPLSRAGSRVTVRSPSWNPAIECEGCTWPVVLDGPLGRSQHRGVERAESVAEVAAVHRLAQERVHQRALIESRMVEQRKQLHGVGCAECQPPAWPADALRDAISVSAS